MAPAFMSTLDYTGVVQGQWKRTWKLLVYLGALCWDKEFLFGVRKRGSRSDNYAQDGASHTLDLGSRVQDLGFRSL